MSLELDKLAELRAKVDASPDKDPGFKSNIADTLALYELVKTLIERIEALEKP